MLMFFILAKSLKIHNLLFTGAEFVGKYFPSKMFELIHIMVIYGIIGDIIISCETISIVGGSALRKKVELIRGDIIGLRPIYNGTGNATEILLRSGELEVRQGINSVLAAVVRSYAIDLKAQRQQLAVLLQRQQRLPFYLNANRVFIPLKMRRPLAEGDSVYGYLDINYLDRVEVVGERRCELSLPDQRRIIVLSSRATVELAQTMGRNLLSQLDSSGQKKSGSSLVAEAATCFYDKLHSIYRKLEHIEHIVDPKRLKTES